MITRKFFHIYVACAILDKFYGTQNSNDEMFVMVLFHCVVGHTQITKDMFYQMVHLLKFYPQL